MQPPPPGAICNGHPWLREKMTGPRSGFYIMINQIQTQGQRQLPGRRACRWTRPRRWGRWGRDPRWRRPWPQETGASPTPRHPPTTTTTTTTRLTLPLCPQTPAGRDVWPGRAASCTTSERTMRVHLKVERGFTVILDLWVYVIWGYRFGQSE